MGSRCRPHEDDLHQSDQAIAFFKKRKMSGHKITFNTSLSEPPRTPASLLALQETDERQACKMLEHKSENPGGTAAD